MVVAEIERELVEACQQGDRDAFRALFLSLGIELRVVAVQVGGESVPGLPPPQPQAGARKLLARATPMPCARDSGAMPPFPSNTQRPRPFRRTTNSRVPQNHGHPQSRRQLGHSVLHPLPRFGANQLSQAGRLSSLSGRGNPTMIDELQRALRSQLGEVGAPAALWDRVETALETPAMPARARVRQPAALVTLAIAVGAVWHSGIWRASGGDLETAALQVHWEFSSHPERLEYRAANAAALQNWVAGNGGVTVRLADAREPLELLGASVVYHRKMRLSAISYRVGPYPATLLIAPQADLTGAPPARNPILPKRRTVPAQGVDIYLWQSHGQAYALVTAPGAGQGVCLLCHTS
jgi:hypothetical protein